MDQNESETVHLINTDQIHQLTNNKYPPLSEWHKSQLQDLSDKGVKCLLSLWFDAPKPTEGLYCNGTWDSIYCWPAVQAGKTITRSCAEVMKDDDELQGIQFTGNAFRICSTNGTWLKGDWTNYSACIENYDEQEHEERAVVQAVRWILFIGCILSLLCLAVSLFIFYYFKSLRCDRITVHVHLMVALALRFTMLIVITEPFIFQRENYYRDVDWVCKGVLSLQLYATLASIIWMFIQGHYLHARLTTNVFDRGTPFKIYYGIGWVLPLILIASWAFVMEKYHPVHCWSKYGDLDYIWIIVGPMVVALMFNLLFLINIMRILLTKITRANTSTDSEQFRRAVKATVILFPLLGINNLLFFWNPGGEYEDAYMVTNTVCQSSQGIFVSILYCFISSDVRDAIRREYRRFSARRSANSIRRTQSSRKRNGIAFNYSKNKGGGEEGGGETLNLNPPTHFKSKFKSPSGERSHSKSSSPDYETKINFLNETPSPTSQNGHLETIDSHTVVIPLKDLR